MSWTDERIDRLKEMWGRGMTASHIADELGGVSRNAVIGKAHRLGLQSRPSPVKPNEPAPRPKKAKAAVAAPPAATRRAVAEAPLPAPELEVDAPEPEAGEAAPETVRAANAPPEPLVRSIGPGGFVRQGP